MKRFPFWIIALALFATGCATSQAGPESPPPEPAEDPAAAAGQADGDGDADGADARADAAQPEADDAGDGQQAQSELPPEIQAGARVADILVSPTPVEITVGDTVALDSFEYTPVDEEGDEVPNVPILFGMVPAAEATVTQDRGGARRGELRARRGRLCAPAGRWRPAPAEDLPESRGRAREAHRGGGGR